MNTFLRVSKTIALVTTVAVGLATSAGAASRFAAMPETNGARSRIHKLTGKLSTEAARELVVDDDRVVTESIVPALLGTGENPPYVLAAPAGPEVGLPEFQDWDQGSGFRRDERDVPLGQTEALSMGPGGFGRVMLGNPGSPTEVWAHAVESSISHIRRHVNVQMLLAVTVPGGGQARFEGAGMDSSARMTIDHQTRVDSKDIGSNTEMYGFRPASPPVDEEQTGVAAGLDLGIMPTFLAQMGVNVSVVATRGAESGDTYLALVSTTELPVDWMPRERPRQHPYGLPINPMRQPLQRLDWRSASIGSGGPPGEFDFFFPPDIPPTPIFPEPIFPEPIEPDPIPEPATLALVGLGAVATWLGRRRRR